MQQAITAHPEEEFSLLDGLLCLVLLIADISVRNGERLTPFRKEL